MTAQLRWSRGIMVHRVLDFPYIASEGPLTMWYMIRSACYDAIVFGLVVYYAVYGQLLFPVSKWDVLVFEVLPPLYNYLRCPAPLPNIFTIIPLYLLYRFTCPAFRMYTFLTPFNTSWALPVTAEPSNQFRLLQFVRREHEGLFFALWSSIAAGAAARAVVSFLLLRDQMMWIAMSSSMVVGWALASYVMFAK
jgi:hypothetical protein